MCTRYVNVAFLLLACTVLIFNLPGCSSAPPKPRVLDVKRRTVTEKVWFEVQIKKAPTVKDASVSVSLTFCLQEKTYKTEIREKLVDGMPAGVETMPEMVEKQTMSNKKYPLNDAVFDRVVINNSILKKGSFENGILNFDYAAILPELNIVSKETKVDIFFIVDGKEEKFSTSLPTQELRKINNIARLEKKFEEGFDSPKLRMELARAYVNGGLKAKGIWLAEDSFKQLEGKYDKDIYSDMAGVYSFAGEPLKAARIYEKMVENGDKEYRTFAMLFFMQGNEHGIAYKIAFEILAENPINGTACATIGEIYVGYGRFGMAYWWYRRALANDKTNQEIKSTLVKLENYFEKNNSGTLERVYGEEGKRYGKRMQEIGTQLNRLAVKYKNAPVYERQKIDRQADQLKAEGEELKKKMTELMEHTEEMQKMLGKAIEAQEKSNFDDCINTCNQIVRKDPKLTYARLIKAAAYELKGLALYKKGKVKEARNLWLDAMDIDARAVLTNALGKKTANTYLEKAAFAYWEMGKQKPVKSRERMELWNQAFTFNPGNAEYSEGVVSGRSRAENIVEAFKTWGEKKEDKTSTPAKETVKQDSEQVANKAFRKILDKKPVILKGVEADLAKTDKAAKLYNDGCDLAKQKKFKEAIESLKKSLAEKEMAETYHQLATCCANGNIELAKAIDYIENASKLYRADKAFSATRNDYSGDKEDAKCLALKSYIYCLKAHAEIEKKKFAACATWLEKAVIPLEIVMDIDKGIESYEQMLTDIKSLLPKIKVIDKRSKDGK